MAKGSKKEGGGIGELLAYAGDRKFLTYLGMALSAFSQLLSFGPYVCIWLVARDLIAVAPNWSEAADIAMYGWWAVGFAWQASWSISWDSCARTCPRFAAHPISARLRASICLAAARLL